MTSPSRLSIAALVAVVLTAGAGSQWWADVSERRMGERMAALAQPGDILMVASETCVFCDAARRWMVEHHVAFRECMIERDAQCEQTFRALMLPGTPVMMVRGQPQQGFDPVRIVERLQQRG